MICIEIAWKKRVTMIIYTQSQIKDIEKAVFELLSYADQHKKTRLSRCYKFCKTILNNIKICRDCNWNAIEELSKYIKEDWDEAIKLHVGQYSNSFYLDEYDYNSEINNEIDRFVQECNICVYKTHKSEEDVVSAVYNGNKYYAPAGVQPDVLNEVYRKALEWGENWRRPIQSIVEETIEETGEAEKQKIAEYIKTVRSDIEEYIYYRYQDFKLEIDYKSLYAWIQNKYPWIDNDNLKHAVSQGIYYAMK